MAEVVRTGSPVLDELLGGGYEKGIITCVYGPAGSGKSNVVLLAVASAEKRVLFVDTEGSFSVDRIMQMNPDVGDLLERVIMLKPTSFPQQTAVIDRIGDMITDDIELVIVDSIASQYRAFLAQNGKDANNELSRQMNSLYLAALEHHIPVLITSQVYADFDSDGVRVVGGDIIKYSSKCMVELSVENEVRKAEIIKHRFLPPGLSREFAINNVGIYERDSNNIEK